MDMNKVIKVSNEKAKTMIYEEDGVRFISKSVNSVDEFNEVFNKKISLVDKGELKFSDMKKITIDGLVVDPHVGMKFGNSVSDISFVNEDDKNEFINFISEKKGWQRKEVQSSVFNAIKWDLLGLIGTPIIAYVVFNMASEMEAGTFVGSEGNSRSERKSRFMESIIEMVGSTGIIIIATLIFAYLGYSVYKKYQKPPILVSYE